MHLGGGREVCSDGQQSEVILKANLGWVVGQKIDEYGNIG
jgi:hypothetical protein